MAAEDETHAGGREHSNHDNRRPSAAPSGARPEFLSLRSGHSIRQYVIEEVIGAGGFGITYRARHERLQAKVFALKEYFPREYAARNGTQVVSTPDGGGTFRWGLERFLKEAEALARCEHAGIVDVVDYFEENGTAYAVLGYIEGQQLGQWLESLGRPPTQAELDRLLMPLLDALDVVHRAKLLHLDIAPDNIIVRHNGQPCLIDFGACREDIRGRQAKVSAIVKHGYSPPEQYHGLAELQGPWTDIYATGATLYRAISGALPMDSARRGTLGDQLKPIGTMARDEYRPPFLAAIDMALRLKPEERPQSVSSWRTMLFRAASPQPVEPPAPRGAQVPSAAPTREKGAAAQATRSSQGSATPVTTAAGVRRPVLLGAIALVLLGSMTALALWRSPEPARPIVAAQPPVVPAPASKSTVPTSPPPKSERPAPTPPVAVAVPPSKSEAPALIPPVAAPPVAAPPVATPPLATSVPLPQIETPAPRPAATVTAPPPVVPAPPRPDPEREAATAWASIAQSSDIGEVERFLARHGATAVADQARARLALLGLEAGQARERDAAFRACQQATDASRVAACSTVITSDDTAERRAMALHLRGVAERRRGNHDKAIADFGQSLALVPNQPDVFDDRGIAHFLRNDSAAAIRDYGEAIRLNPRHADALNNRAWAVFQAGRAADALPDANRAVELAPGRAYVFDTRGHILEALGRRDDAIRDYERAVALDATQEDSRRALERLRLRR